MVEKMFSHGPVAVFFSVATSKSKRSLLHFTTSESVVTGDPPSNSLV